MTDHHRTSPDYQAYHHHNGYSNGMMEQADDANQNVYGGGARVGDKHDDGADDDVYGHMRSHQHHQPAIATVPVQPEEIQRPSVIEQRHFIECT